MRKATFWTGSGCRVIWEPLCRPHLCVTHHSSDNVVSAQEVRAARPTRFCVASAYRLANL